MSRRRGDGPGGSTWVDGVGFTHNPDRFGWVAESRQRGRERTEESRLSEYERAERADSAPGATRVDRINYMIASLRRSLFG